MYIVQYTMTYARNISVSKKRYLNYALYKVIMERNEPQIMSLYIIYAVHFILYYWSVQFCTGQWPNK